MYNLLVHSLSLFVQPPMQQLGTRLPSQDYEKLRRQCIRDNTLFEDPYFPADESSLFFSQKLPFKPEWKRPKVCGGGVEW